MSAPIASSWTLLEWDEATATVMSRPLSREEVLTLKAEHGIIDDDVLRELGLLKPRGRFYEAARKRAVRVLFVTGFGVESIEDWFGITTAELGDLRTWGDEPRHTHEGHHGHLAQPERSRSERSDT